MDIMSLFQPFRINIDNNSAEYQYDHSQIVKKHIVIMQLKVFVHASYFQEANGKFNLKNRIPSFVAKVNNMNYFEFKVNYFLDD